MVLDTNVLVSALLVPSGVPGAIYRSWREKQFTLLTSSVQMDELRRTLAKPALAVRIHPHHAGRLINSLSRLAEMIAFLPRIERSSDPDDNFLLAMAEAGRAEYLVTGDKSGLLSLNRHARTRIISARGFADLLP